MPSMTADITAATITEMGRKGEKEVIHSGHFMVSDFEAAAQDDEENVLLEIPGDTTEELNLPNVRGHNPHHLLGAITYAKKSRVETVNIDSSLTKLFNAMSIAYRYVSLSYFIPLTALLISSFLSRLPVIYSIISYL